MIKCVCLLLTELFTWFTKGFQQFLQQQQQQQQQQR